MTNDTLSGDAFGVAQLVFPDVPSSGRWTASFKQQVVNVLLSVPSEQRETSFSYALEKYPDASRAELIQWLREYEVRGKDGLKVTLAHERVGFDGDLPQRVNLAWDAEHK